MKEIDLNDTVPVEHVFATEAHLIKKFFVAINQWLLF